MIVFKTFKSSNFQTEIYIYIYIWQFLICSYNQIVIIEAHCQDKLSGVNIMGWAVKKIKLFKSSKANGKILKRASKARFRFPH